MTREWTRFLWVLCALVMSACATADVGRDAATLCSPGEPGSCVCPNGRTSFNNCNNAGTAYGQCVCSPCVPQCTGRACGDDTCGGTCGSCLTDQFCNPSQRCETRQLTCSPACGRGFACQGTTCVLDPSSLWVVSVASGTVTQRNCAGDTWDALGGLPDPRFCMTINGMNLCTESAADTLSPRWTMGRFPAATAGMLSDGVQVSYEDVDVTTNDIICAGPFPFGVDTFRTGTASLNCPCPSGAVIGTVTMTLTPQ